MELVEVLKTAVQSGASDIHIVIGKPPMMRLNGEIAEIPGFPVINGDESKRMIYSILYEEQRSKFEESWELDCSFAVSGSRASASTSWCRRTGWKPSCASSLKIPPPSSCA